MCGLDSRAAFTPSQGCTAVGIGMVAMTGTSLVIKARPGRRVLRAGQPARAYLFAAPSMSPVPQISTHYLAMASKSQGDVEATSITFIALFAVSWSSSWGVVRRARRHQATEAYGSIKCTGYPHGGDNWDAHRVGATDIAFGICTLFAVPS